MRIGNGYDIHKLIDGDFLTIGGETIQSDKAILAHSDGDVLIHAIIDAILGALALGDIGKFFPDNDDKYKGISSMELLNEVYQFMKHEKYSIVNIDSTVVLERPKLRPHIDNMRKNIADAIHTSIDNINVKATCSEKMGFVGRYEGIKAYAVVLIKKDN